MVKVSSFTWMATSMTEIGSKTKLMAMATTIMLMGHPIKVNGLSINKMVKVLKPQPMAQPTRAPS